MMHCLHRCCEAIYRLFSVWVVPVAVLGGYMPTQASLLLGRLLILKRTGLPLAASKFQWTLAAQ